MMLQLTRIPMAVRAPKRRKKLSKSQRPRKPSFPILSSKLLTCLAAALQTAKSESNTPSKSKLYIYGSRKKGMMRLMNFCFRTIIEEAELYINPNIQKEAHSSKCVDKKERTIFYLSSNYRYKHIEKCNSSDNLALFEDFKIVCKNYVKYHCL